ncbi:MAG: phosphoribosylanthranilate isomerase [Gammaproteobacteria bacterium]|nr:phosphoribosylanthranilate isomerase [Gammaproteobacteria bacterium]
MRTRIKICGITQPEDGLQAALLGADAIGLVFYDKSPRAVTVSTARAIVDALPPFTTVTALFFNSVADDVRTVLAGLAVDMLQFHGNEPPEFCRAFDLPYIKAFAGEYAAKHPDLPNEYHDAKGWLFDSQAQDSAGGSGHAFTWGQLPKEFARPVILAGGLTPENVAAAIKQVNPYAVDVSSGVEASPGKKDLAKMRDFINGVNSVG